MTPASRWSEGEAGAWGPGKAMAAIAAIFLLAAVGLSAAFRAAEWRAGTVLLPRYCDQRETHLGLLRRLLSEREPAGEERRRPYIVVAKLLFLVPRDGSEPVDTYIDRVRARIDEACR